MRRKPRTTRTYPKFTQAEFESFYDEYLRKMEILNHFTKMCSIEQARALKAESKLAEITRLLVEFRDEL